MRSHLEKLSLLDDTIFIFMTDKSVFDLKIKILQQEMKTIQCFFH